MDDLEELDRELRSPFAALRARRDVVSAGAPLFALEHNLDDEVPRVPERAEFARRFNPVRRQGDPPPLHRLCSGGWLPVRGRVLAIFRSVDARDGFSTVIGTGSDAFSPSSPTSMAALVPPEPGDVSSRSSAGRSQMPSSRQTCSATSRDYSLTTGTASVRISSLTRMSSAYA